MVEFDEVFYKLNCHHLLNYDILIVILLVHKKIIINKYILLFLPISLLNIRPCISMLLAKPSATASAYMLVDEPFQLKKQLCASGFLFLVLDRSHNKQ